MYKRQGCIVRFHRVTTSPPYEDMRQIGESKRQGVCATPWVFERPTAATCGPNTDPAKHTWTVEDDQRVKALQQWGRRHLSDPSSAFAAMKQPMRSLSEAGAMVIQAQPLTRQEGGYDLIARLVSIGQHATTLCSNPGAHGYVLQSLSLIHI